MTIVKKQGIWSNSLYPWTDTTSAGYMGSIVAEIDTWIAAISSNPSIVANGMLPVKVRDPSSSTNGGATNGFAYQFPDTRIGLNNAGPTWPTLLVQGTDTFLKVEAGDEYQDTAVNNGFGSIGDSPGHSSTRDISGDVGYNNQAVLFYDTTDGEEFIGVGFKRGIGAGDGGGILVFRDTNGYWCFLMEDAGLAYDTVLGYWTGYDGPNDTNPVLNDSNNSMRPLVVMANTSSPPTNLPNYDGEIQGRWYPTNSALYSGLGTISMPGDFALVNGGTEAIVMLGYNSAAVRVSF